MSASVSIASSRDSNSPRRAKVPAAATQAAGAASDSAQGQVTISTDTATATAREGSINCHASAARPASTSTAARNHPATRSAMRSVAGRSWKACVISWRMPASRVCSPTCRTRSISTPWRFRLPASTSSPGAFATGLDSPVSSDSSTAPAPASTVASAGMRCPAATRTRSPGASCATGTVSTLPSGFWRSTRSGSSPAACSSACAARCRARSSRYRAPSRKATNMVIESK